MEARGTKRASPHTGTAPVTAAPVELTDKKTASKKAKVSPKAVVTKAKPAATKAAKAKPAAKAKAGKPAEKATKPAAKVVKTAKLAAKAKADKPAAKAKPVKPAAKAVKAKPAAKEAKSVAKEAKPVTKTTKPAVKAKAVKPAAKKAKATKPATKAKEAKPAAKKPASKPAAKPAAKPVAKPATKPAAKPAAKTAAKRSKSGPLEVGTDAPDFSVKDQDGAEVTLGSFKGQKNVVVFFYPKDNTPGCTKEACKFRDLKDEYDALDCTVLGVSADHAVSHGKFIAKYGLTFTLLADTDRCLIKSYGASKAGDKIQRSTVLIDKSGQVAGVWNPVSGAEQHPVQVLEKLKEIAAA